MQAAERTCHGRAPQKPVVTRIDPSLKEGWLEQMAERARRTALG
jgi:hypothetical protein